MNLPERPLPGDENARSDVESGIYCAHYKPKPGDVVLDIGAHVGFFAEWVWPKISPNGTLHCFEPHPRNFAELQKRMHPQPNLVLHQSACGRDACSAVLWHHPKNSGGHSCYSQDYRSYGFSVDVVNIGHLILRLELKPDFVKIDTEGAEADIIETILAVCRPKAFAVEMHSDDLFQDCRQQFLDAGYLFQGTGVTVCYANLP